MFHIQVLHTLDLFGTVVFAASGALIAHEQRRNGFLAVFYAALTALGGGSIRDIVLRRHPVFWVRSPAYLWLSGAVGLLTFGLAKVTPLHRKQLWFADTISLAVFTIVGAQVVMSSPALAPVTLFHWGIPLLMGLMTGVGGGVMRDVLGGRTPYVIKHPSYPLASLIGASVYCLLVRVQAPAICAIGGAIATVILILSTPAQGIVKLRPL